MEIHGGWLIIILSVTAVISCAVVVAVFSTEMKKKSEDCAVENSTQDQERRDVVMNMRGGNIFPRGALKETSERWRMNRRFSIYSPGESITTYTPTIDAVPAIASTNLNDNPQLAYRVYNPPWEKIGVVASRESREIMNLLRRPLIPSQDMWEYKVQDKHGFEIPLKGTDYISNGDIIHHIFGKEGEWKVLSEADNAWIYF
jgi:hypothetical protein